MSVSSLHHKKSDQPAGIVAKSEELRHHTVHAILASLDMGSSSLVKIQPGYRMASNKHAFRDLD